MQSSTSQTQKPTGPNTYAACSSCQAVNRVRIDQQDSAKCAKCKTALPLHGGVVEVGDKEFFALIKSSPIPVVVDFWAEWCGPCKMFAPTFAQAAQQLAGEFVFAKLNTELHSQAAQTFHVRGIPALMMFKEGKLVKQQAGAVPLPTFVSWLKSK